MGFGCYLGGMGWVVVSKVLSVGMHACDRTLAKLQLIALPAVLLSSLSLYTSAAGTSLRTFTSCLVTLSGDVDIYVFKEYPPAPCIAQLRFNSHDGSKKAHKGSPKGTPQPGN